MTKKELEKQVESLTESLQKTSQAMSYILNIVKLWQHKDIGNYRAITTIANIFIEKEKKGG